MKSCRLCPLECRVDRERGQLGRCQSGNVLKIAQAYLHRWEEPCISGEKGSGTVFFSGCNLRCIYCQNYRISQEGHGRPVSISRFSEICLELQKQGAHNINLVSPSHYVPLVKEGLVLARSRGLSIPVVYNSNAYEKRETLRLLEGLIDIYLPDLKYYDDSYAQAYSGVGGYFQTAARAIGEMLRQVGEPRFSKEGLLEKGLLIRHLMLPGLSHDTRRILEWIAREIPRGVYVSLMGQFTPVHKAAEYPALNRRLTIKEYEEVIDYFLELGLENGFIQDLASADTSYIPEFDLRGL